MTDLNMSLWIAGGAVILSVIAYNFWQEYKAKKNIDTAFGQHQDDVLMKQNDSLPDMSALDTAADTFSGALSHNASYNANAGNQLLHRQEPTLHDVCADENQADENQAELRRAEIRSAVEPENAAVSVPVDDFIDCVISMEFEVPTRGDKVMGEIQSFHQVGNKPVHFIGADKDGRREVINPATTYTHLLAGVQLVTRSGALSELEYSQLVMKLRQIADNLNAHPDIPDMKHVMDAGRDLHLFVTEHDARLSVNVKSKGTPWGVDTLLIALEKMGFDAHPGGRLTMPDGEGGALFTLSINGGVGQTDQTTGRLTLLLDVPCVAPSRGGFGAMISCAKSLALRLGGSLVDDGNELLSEATLEEIQQQVDLFYGAMQAAEIPAGSTRAVRIFS